MTVQIFPSLAERLAEWNSLASEFDRLFAQYRSTPRSPATAKIVRRAWNSVSWRGTDMTWALVDPRPDQADEAGRHVDILRLHVEKLRAALERDAAQRGRRSVSNLEMPDLRLPETIEAVRTAYAAKRSHERQGSFSLNPPSHNQRFSPA
jgi:hypothetical protein